MCGRYYRRSDKKRIAEAFHLGKLSEGFVLRLPTTTSRLLRISPVIRANMRPENVSW